MTDGLRAGCPIAVIDVGSNSGRVVVVELSPEGHLSIVADARSPLRLARDVAQSGRLGAAGIDRTVEALRDFRSVATGAGVQRIVAVATAAVRTAEDGEELVRRTREEVGVDVEVIDGAQEAAYAFLGAIHGLPAEHGLLVDVGGGSTEVSQFRDRRLVRSWTLPLGALLLSDRFLLQDPPEDDEVEALRDHVAETIREEGIPSLRDDEQLVGTGGTVRNLASIDERRHRYAIPHLHGYLLTRQRVGETASLLLGRRRAKRRATPGLNADRADSIVGGALIVHELMRRCDASDVMISGQGLREGVALSVLGWSDGSAAALRTVSVAALCSRFSTWTRERADRRAGAATALLRTLAPSSDAETVEMTTHAARILDLGRAVDYYERHRHAADVFLAADLAGFSHSQVAFVASIVRQAGGERPGKPFRALLSKEHRAAVSRAGAALGLADEVERRTPPGEPLDVACRVEGRDAIVSAPVLAAWRARALGDRFLGAFHLRLVIEPKRG